MIININDTNIVELYNENFNIFTPIYYIKNLSSIDNII